MSTDSAEDEQWVQGLLASLPRPDMPEGVAARLDAITGSTGGAGGAGPVVLPPQQRIGGTTHAGRRRTWLLAAAGAAVAVVGFSLVDPLGGQPSAPLAEPGRTIAASPEPSGQPAPSATETTTDTPPDAEATVGTDVTGALMASQTDYTSDGLPQQTLAVADAQQSAATTQPSAIVGGQWAAAAAAPAASTSGAADCVAGLRAPDGELLFVDRAAYEGSPALIVALRTDGVIEVHVLRPTCTASNPEVVLSASVPVP